MTTEPHPSGPALDGPLADFLFDLTGYLVLRRAVEPGLLARLNAEFDAFPRHLARGEWHRGAQRRDYTPETGFELHQAVAAGEPFEELIDHPSWLPLVTRFAGEQGSYVEGVFIDESIASARGPGGRHPLHSGGHRAALRNQYGYAHGAFRCGMVNIILALTDVGPGDGPTMLVPGSHKANLPHPLAHLPMEELPGAEPMHLRAGDALLFVDALLHGGATRTNPGERRVVIYRYGPVWGSSRYGYAYDEKWLAGLTGTRRAILRPLAPIRPGD
ncbi:phytanoyl-CoA dioxygenase family protein [Nonomuraea sp. NPDC050310]|uniref:phytanoyl-CoA dioxygenase family protein n=1 Tax=Nonomuraea sp. NPDC050310 TaxID=3154935 RepID=UPI0033F8C1F3